MKSSGLLTRPGFGYAAGLFLLATHSLLAQHHPAAGTGTPAAPAAALQFAQVLNQPLTDPALKEYVLQSSRMTVPPGFTDTVAHRHDAELFGYVLEGSVEVQLEKTPSATYQPGQMFYEPRNVLHTLLRNQSTTQPAAVLLLFIIKKGRASYVPAGGATAR